MRISHSPIDDKIARSSLNSIFLVKKSRQQKLIMRRKYQLYFRAEHVKDDFNGTCQRPVGTIDC